MSSNVKFLVVAIAIIVIISAFLIGFSFERVGYNENAILINNFTQKIYYEDKYNEPGLFFIGIEKSFIRFPKYLIFTEFVGTVARDENGEVNILNLFINIKFKGY